MVQVRSRESTWQSIWPAFEHVSTLSAKSKPILERRAIMECLMTIEKLIDTDASMQFGLEAGVDMGLAARHLSKYGLMDSREASNQ
eukprot:3058296-Rhodomonas_salina.1